MEGLIPPQLTETVYKEHWRVGSTLRHKNSVFFVPELPNLCSLGLSYELPDEFLWQV